VEVLRWA